MGVLVDLRPQHGDLVGDAFRRGPAVALAGREGYGGTAPERVADQITVLRAAVDEHAHWAAGDAS